MRVNHHSPLNECAGARSCNHQHREEEDQPEGNQTGTAGSYSGKQQGAQMPRCARSVTARERLLNQSIKVFQPIKVGCCLGMHKR